MRAPTSEQIRAAARIVATTTVVGHAEPGAGDAFRLTITALHERAERVQKAEEYEAAYGAADLEVALLIADTVDGTPDDYLDAARAVREHYAQDAEPAPVTISADATGLKGRRAKIIGPAQVAGGTGSPVTGYETGDTTIIASRRVSIYGNVELADGGWIAVSSLALIPDEPEEPARCGDLNGGMECNRNPGHEGGHWNSGAQGITAWGAGDNKVIPEPPVGTRLRDKRGNVWERRDAAHKFCWSSDGITPPYTFDLLMQHHGPLHQVWTSWADVPKGVTVVDARGSRRIGSPTMSPGDRHPIHAPFVAVTPFGAGL